MTRAWGWGLFLPGPTASRHAHHHPFSLDLVMEAAVQTSLSTTCPTPALAVALGSTRGTPTLGQGAYVPRMEPHLG